MDMLRPRPAAGAYPFTKHLVSDLQSGRANSPGHSSLVTSESVAGFFFFFLFFLFVGLFLRLRRGFDLEVDLRRELVIDVNFDVILAQRPTRGRLGQRELS